MLGEPTGLSAKYWLTRQHALDFGLSYSFRDYFEILGDYLWHFRDAFDGTRVSAEFVPYVGVGVVMLVNTRGDGLRVGSDRRTHDVVLGARVPLGIEFLPQGAPLGIFVEVAPGLEVIPASDAFIQGAIGARFYF